MKPAVPALVLLLALSPAVRAEESGRATVSHVAPVRGGGESGLVLMDLVLSTVAFGVEVAALESAAPPAPQPAYPQRFRDDDSYWRPPRRQMDAREGLLLSFGLGGSSAYLSSQGPGRTGAFDLDFRLGYGFSDRFQLFMDFGVDAGRYPQSSDFASWTFTVRGQTVLVGDRAGNGLSLNAGIGVGGVDYNDGYYGTYSSSTGLALAGGLSYDARVTPWFALSPEVFLNWHQIPNSPGLPHDVASAYGVRLNFLWYLK